MEIYVKFLYRNFESFMRNGVYVILSIVPHLLLQISISLSLVPRLALFFVFFVFLFLLQKILHAFVSVCVCLKWAPVHPD